MIAEIGKTLVAIGAGVLLLGGLLWLSSGTFKHFPIGRLPGDILIQNEHVTFEILSIGGVGVFDGIAPC